MYRMRFLSEDLEAIRSHLFIREMFLVGNFDEEALLQCPRSRKCYTLVLLPKQYESNYLGKKLVIVFIYA